MLHPCPTCNGSGHVEVTPVQVLAPPKPIETDEDPKKPGKSKVRGLPWPSRNLKHLRTL
jgi:Ribonuclease G/E